MMIPQLVRTEHMDITQLHTHLAVVLNEIFINDVVADLFAYKTREGVFSC